MKISFYGSTDIISIGVLKALHQKSIKGELELVYVISQPPKPFGRKRELKHNPVAQYALENDIPLFMPEKLNELFSTEYGPAMILKAPIDLAIVASYGKIISEKVLATPKYGFINFHVSLLPQYRGAGPVPMSILNQDDKTGLTIIKMDKGMDTGEIIRNEELEVRKNITAGELMREITDLCERVIYKDAEYIFNPESWKLTKQDHDQATYCYEKDLTKENFEIHYSDTVKQAHGKIMAANPEPGGWGKLRVKNEELRMNLWRSVLEDSIIPELEKSDSLRLVSDEFKKRLFLEVSDGFLEILEIQPEGKKIMDAKSFVNGYLR
jgi:methionyl-tRNA formyltransferase